MRHTLHTFLFILISSLNLWAQGSSQFWSVDEDHKKSVNQKVNQVVVLKENSENSLLSINRLSFYNSLSQNVIKKSSNQTAIVELPLPDGTYETFEVYEETVMETGLQEQFPEIRTFVGRSKKNGYRTVRFVHSQKGIYGSINDNHYGKIYVRPIVEKTPTSVHISYYLKDVKPQADGHTCGTIEQSSEELLTQKEFKTTNCQLRTYRIAISSRSTDSGALGGTVADVIWAYAGRVLDANEVLENEISVRLQMSAETNKIIFTDSSSDPFNNVTGDSNLAARNQFVLDILVGTSDYEIGHLLRQGSGGVVTNGIPSVCKSNKARAVSGLEDPTTFLHELGHQFGADHTWSSATPSTQLRPFSAMEPGAGYSIMSYAHQEGRSRILNFHARNLIQIKSFLNSATNSCVHEINHNNIKPNLTISPAVYLLPIGTPFVLSVDNVFDSDDVLSSLTYTWDQIDAIGSNPQPPNSTSTGGPLFRYYAPSSERERYFPPLPDVAQGVIPAEEVLPEVSRVCNFTVTARDNNSSGGCYDQENLSLVFTDAAGPFRITDTDGTEWNAGSSYTLTWDVAGTDGFGINESQVEIWLSSNEGESYDHFIKTTANDGSTDINVSNSFPTASRGRIMVKAKNKIFFTSNTEDLRINAADLVVTNNNDSGLGSLRHAINFANATPGKQDIIFEIPNASQSENRTITPLSPLPTITEELRIIGDMPGSYSTNVDAIIDASGFAYALRVLNADSNNPSSVGVEINNLKIKNASSFGIEIIGSEGVRITDSDISDCNIAIYLNNSNDAEIIDNNLNGNGTNLYGLSLFNSAGSTIISNGISDFQTGINISGTDAKYNYISDNNMSCNQDGINLVNGANQNMPAPVITVVGDDTVEGTSQAGARIQIYVTDSECVGLECQGFLLVGSTTAASNGTWSINQRTFTLNLVDCGSVVATATNADNSTSDFSNCILNYYCVHNTNNAGSGSLRQAILNANTSTRRIFIQFRIPGDGPHQINLQSPLPALTDDININAPFDPRILLDGSNISGTDDILTIQGSNIEISQLEIKNSPGSAIHINGTHSDIDINQNFIYDNNKGITSSSLHTVTNLSIGNNKIGLDKDDNQIGNAHEGIQLYNDEVELTYNEVVNSGATAIDLIDVAKGLVKKGAIFCNAGTTYIQNNNAPPAPVITGFSDQNAEISGTGIPGANIQIYSMPWGTCSNTCDRGGTRFIREVDVDESGIWSAELALCGKSNISATQTVSDHTSDFSNCWQSYFTVVQIAHASENFAGSLAWAVGCTNRNPGPDEIIFDLPDDEPLKISLILGSIPEITDIDLTIDASSQEGLTLNPVYPINAPYAFEVSAPGFELYGIEIDRAIDNFIKLNSGADNFIIGAANKENSIAKVTGNAIEVWANNGLINNNHFTENGNAVWIEDGASNVTVKQNSFVCNDAAIELNGLANNQIASPVITLFSSSTISGTSAANTCVEIYSNETPGCSDDPCQGSEFIDVTTADGSGNWSISGTFTSYAFITATATGTNGNTSEFADCLTRNSCLEVTNINNSGPGSLREAINCANSSSTADLIYFNIPGQGPFIIEPLSALPNLIDGGTIIDGTTQPGWMPGSLIVWGISAGAATGLIIDGDNCEVLGMQISSFGSSAINVRADNCIIGGNGKSNVITNNGAGIIVNDDADNSTISHNFIGIFADTIGIGPNGGNGILFFANNSGATVKNNIIAHSGNHGIRLGGSNVQQVTMSQNLMWCNANNGIDVFGTANASISPPTILSIDASSVSGTAGANQTIEVYEVDYGLCFGSNCQGRYYLGSANSDALGEWTLSVPLQSGFAYVATATDSQGNTSELTQCSSVQPACLEVYSLADSGPGSLRDAINCANSNPLVDTITFSFSDMAPPFQININSTLPNLNGGVIVDATTQDGYYPGMIIIDGGNITSGQYGMTMNGNNNQLYGLMMRDFPVNAIRIYSGTTNAVIGKENGGNIFCSNGNSVIQIFSSDMINIEHNMFGLNPNGSSCGIGSANGISASGLTHAFIRNNQFAHMATGISLNSSSEYVYMQENQFFCNTSNGIRFNGSANGGIQRPTIIDANTGEISGTTGASQFVEVYYDDEETCASSPCQGETVIGVALSDASGNWSLSGTFDLNRTVTAVTTDGGNNTSSFALCQNITQGCPDYIDVDENPIPTALYQASTTVLTYSPLATGADVTFKSGYEIKLEPGFDTTLGQTFSAIIELCN